MTRFAIYNNAANQFFGGFGAWSGPDYKRVVKFSKDVCYLYDSKDNAAAVIPEILHVLGLTENKVGGIGENSGQAFLVVVSVRIEVV